MKEGTGKSFVGTTEETEFNFVIKRSNLLGAPLMCVNTQDVTAQSGYGTQSPGRDYLYRLDCQQQSPFNFFSLTATITVYFYADSVPENHETFLVRLSSCSGCNFDDNTAIGTIINDD